MHILLFSLLSYRYHQYKLLVPVENYECVDATVYMTLTTHSNVTESERGDEEQSLHNLNQFEAECVSVTY